jgi:hypothetical protein
LWGAPNAAETAAAEQAIQATMMKQHAFNVAGSGAYFQKAGTIQEPKKENTFKWPWKKK